MKIMFKGRTKTVTLSQNDFIAKGGEGAVYQKGGLCYKVCEPKHMIPAGKFKVLAELDDPHIVRPLESFDTDDGNNGYTMNFVSDSIALCQLVTMTYRNKNNVTPEMMLKLVRQMQAGFHFVHSKRCLIVDANELNFLINQAKDFIHFIDVNSYETPGYPATAVMKTVRDHQVKRVGPENHFQWTTGSDWFAFAVTSFQMFIGMHPYKGKHPNFPDPKTAMEGCMKSNLSVLNSAVRFPKAACMPFDIIPEVYRRWYEAVLEQGQRIAPPSDLVAVIHVTTPLVTQVKQVSKKFTIGEVARFGAPVVKHFYLGGHQMVSTSENQVYVDGRLSMTAPTPVKMGVTSKGTPIAAYLENGAINLFDLSGGASPIQTNMVGESLMSCGGRIYFKQRTNFYEIMFSEIGGHVYVTPNLVINVTDQATQVFEGVVVQTLFDAHHISIFPNSAQCRQYSLRDLDGYKVVDARYDKRVLMILAVDTKTGQYDRFIFRFARDFGGHDMRVVKNIPNMGLNFTVLDNHRVACITEEEKLEIFLSEKDHPAVSEFDDPAIEADMLLTSRLDDALFSRAESLYSITARTP